MVKAVIKCFRAFITQRVLAGVIWMQNSPKTCHTAQTLQKSDITKACQMGKFTAEERLSQFRVAGEVIAA